MPDVTPEALDTIEAEIEQMAEAMALAGDEDGCFERVKAWEAQEQWEKDAHPDERPHGDYEDCEYWRVKAGAAYAVVQPDLRRLSTENEEQQAVIEQARKHNARFEVDHSGHHPHHCLGEQSWTTQEARDLGMILAKAPVRAALTGEGSNATAD